MTEQYQQTNINQPMSGARIVDQRDIDTTLPVPGVPLNEDDEFIFAGDNNNADYTIFLPDVREVTGKDIVIKFTMVGVVGFPTISALQTTTPPQTIDGVATLGPLAVDDSVVLRADPPDTHVTPAIPSSNWSVIRTGAP